MNFTNKKLLFLLGLSALYIVLFGRTILQNIGTEHYIAAVNSSTTLGAFMMNAPVTSCAENGSQIALSWTPSENAAKYTVYRSDAGSDAFSVVMSTTETNEVDITMNEGEAFVYKVEATKSVRKSSSKRWSDNTIDVQAVLCSLSSSVSPATPPPVPVVAPVPPPTPTPIPTPTPSPVPLQPLPATSTPAPAPVPPPVVPPPTPVVPPPAPVSSPTPTPTPTPAPVPVAAPVAPPVSTKFFTGSRILVQQKINVRTSASLSSKILGSQAVGKLGTVLEGPKTASGYVWWRVDYDSGSDGWSIENYITVAPVVSPSPAPVPVPVPTLTLSASKTSVTANETTTLSWTATNVTSCTAGGGWSGTKTLAGTQIVTLGALSTTYTLACAGTNTTTQRSLNIEVLPPVLPPPPSPGTTSTALNQQVGISAGWTLAALSSANLNKELDDLVSLGVTWVRFDISWNYIQEFNATTYDWSAIDRIVAAANARNIKLMPILLYTPLWARLDECKTLDDYCAPKDPQQFATFAKEAVKRYAPQGIHTWEIWNEQNTGKWWGAQGNIVGYSKLLIAASAAMKEADPTAFIVSGGLAPADTNGENYAPRDFLRGMYANGAKTAFDAVGAHPYTYPVPANYVENWNAWMEMSTANDNLRAIMAVNGDSAKPMWITEYGAPTGGPGVLAEVNNYRLNSNPNPDHVTDELQALILSEAVKLNREYSWSGPIFWYSYADLGTSQSTSENFFGIIRFDGSKKPAYSTLKTLLGK